LCAEHYQLYHDALADFERLTNPKLEEKFLGALLQQTPTFIKSLSDNLFADIFTSNLRKEVFNYLLSRAKRMFEKLKVE
jgi:hypothetical protein